MPHFKCVGCKLRVHTGPGRTDHIGDLCPTCGVPLQPVAELAEIVGFRAIEIPDETITLPGVQTVALPLPGTEL